MQRLLQHVFAFHSFAVSCFEVNLAFSQGFHNMQSEAGSPTAGVIDGAQLALRMIEAADRQQQRSKRLLPHVIGEQEMLCFDCYSMLSTWPEMIPIHTSASRCELADIFPTLHPI